MSAAAPESPEQLAEHIQRLLMSVKSQYEQMTRRVTDALDDINKRVDTLEQNVSQLLESVASEAPKQG